MKIIQKLLIVFLIVTTQKLYAQPAVSEFVSVDGNKFMYQGQPFFPVMMNFSVAMYRPNSNPNSGFYLVAQGDDNPSPGSSYTEIVQLLQEIRQKGFNSIRLLGFKVGPYCTSVDPNAYCNKCTETNDIYYDWYTASPFNTYHTAAAAPYTELFNGLDIVLAAAKEADLKVMLLTGRQAMSSGTLPLFNTYLGNLVDHLKNNPTVFAYDLQNEPSYNDDDCYVKSQICSIVHDWTTIVHSRSHQLTTLAVSPDDVFAWDPGILDLDFFSPHIYPPNAPNVGQNGIDQAKHSMYWFHQSDFGVPWMIGESGFSAQIGDANVTTDQGQIADQINYSQQTINYCRDCGGTGYAWWSLYDDGVNAGYMNYLGLRDYYPPFGTGAWKPGVTAPFENFAPTAIPANCTQPPTYLDPMDYQHMGTPDEVHGYVRDQYLQPIANAVVKVFFGTLQTTSYTDANGYYQVWFPLLPSDIWVSAPGCSRNGVSDPHALPNYYQHDFQLTRLNATVPENLTLSFVSVPIGQSRSDQARGYIEASDFIVDGNGTTGGSSEMKAQDYIKLKQGFRAKKGSAFHAYLGPIRPDCGSVSSIDDFIWEQLGYRKSNPDSATTPARNTFALYPNPFGNVFTIASGMELPFTVEVMDVMGQSVKQQENYTGSTATIDMTGLASAVYIVSVKTATAQYLYRIVKQ